MKERIVLEKADSWLSLLKLQMWKGLGIKVNNFWVICSLATSNYYEVRNY